MSRSNGSVVTSISLAPELHQALQKISRERKSSVSTFIADLIQKEISKRDKLLASQYAEAEQDADRQALIDDLKKLDDDGWPNE